jgi:hypothetical protein
MYLGSCGPVVVLTASGKGNSLTNTREHLAQNREIVLQNLVESMRDQFVVQIGGHIANIHVPAGANFECHINLSELGKILLCEVLNFGGGRLLLDNTLLDGLCRGLAFLATLLGMTEKTSAL